MSKVSTHIARAATGLALVLAATGALAATDGFLENRGQLDARVRFYAETTLGTVYVTVDAIVIDMHDALPAPADRDGVLADPARRGGCAVYLNLGTATAGRDVTARDPRPGERNFLTGDDPSTWRTGVRSFAVVEIARAWPDRDLSLRLDGGRLRYAVTEVGTGLPAAADFAFAGVEDAVPQRDGGWRLDTSRGALFIAPDGPQDASAVVTRADPGGAIAAASAATAPDRAAAKAAGDLIAATFLGGSSTDQCDAVALDPEGRPVLTGYTISSDFPSTPGAYNESYFSSYDVWTAKLSADGDSLLWSTFFGASGEERARGIAVDADGAVIVSGYTTSNHFPVTPGVFDETYNGGRDMFALKLSADGDSLMWGTYVGGGLDESTMAMDLDPDGNPVLAGYTGSTDYPTTPGAYDETYNGPLYDAFVTVLDNADGTMHASTYTGALGRDVARAVGADADGAPIVAGFADNGDFPVTAGSHDQTFNGGYADVVVWKLSPDLTTLEWSTFFGGDGDDRGLALDITTDGDPVVTGFTQSTDLPTTPGAYREFYNHVDDVFAARFDGAAGTLDWATYIGAYYGEIGHGLTLDGDGNPLIVGLTSSGGFPTTPDAYDATINGGEDVFLTRLSADGSTLLYSTFLGGSDDEDCTAVAFDPAGRAVLIGTTQSTDFPVFAAAYDTTQNGGIDGFLAVFDLGQDLPPAPATDLAAAGGDSLIAVTWTDPADPDLALVEVWRSWWHDDLGLTAYPEYDDHPGQVLPARPASRAEALASPDWTLVDSVAAGVGACVDTAAVRGLYLYEVFPVDAAGHYAPPAASGARALSYLLGDFAPPEGTADGVVDATDAALLASIWGAAAGDTNWDGQLDIGPTDDGTGAGIPATDGAVDFEDLMILAVDHEPALGGTAGADDPAPVALHWRSSGLHTWTLVLEAAHPDLKGLRLTAAVAAGTATAAAGSLLTAQAAPVFCANIDARGLDVGCALLGAGQVIDGAGDVVTVVLPGGVSPAVIVVEARSRSNAPLAIDLDTVTGVPSLPAARLDQNVPNPFNPQTAIRFAVPDARRVRLEILDLTGRRVAVLVDGRVEAGEHTAIWDGRDDRGRRVASGTYFYRLDAGNEGGVRKLVLLK